MLDLPQEILRCLAGVDRPSSPGGGRVTSRELAAQLQEDHQRVVGAVKSLECLDGVISADILTEKRWTLSGEGEGVVAGGSHEARVHSLVPGGGASIPQPELLKQCGDWGKVGFSKAMANGWIAIDKTGGQPLVRRKVENVEDEVRRHLEAVAAGRCEGLEERLRNEYKKRKLVEELVEKVYVISRGSNFSTSVEKVPTELTPEMLSSGSWRTTRLKHYNLNSLGTDLGSGCLHPLLKVRAEYRQIFLEMGFSEMPANNYVESSFWNFDALFQPQQHPARDAHDTFFISDPGTSDRFPGEYLERVKAVHSRGGFGSQGYGYDWKIEEASKNLLRTHTTAVSARMLYRLAQCQEFVPQKYFSIDRVFRNETLDATHLAEFHQIEGVVADYGLTLGDCIGVINTFFTKLGIQKLRFKPAYNPYTEPSMEIFSYHEGLGKWVEIGNSGMFRPEMLLPMGLPTTVNVIGFGLSLERPTMIKYRIDNIRDLVGHRVNLGMVKTNPICRIDKENNQEARLVAILNQRFGRLEERLQHVVGRLKALGITTNTSAAAAVNASGARGGIDVIVRASPCHPPHSLATLASLLAKVTRVHTSQHVHSSVNKPGPDLLSRCDVSRSEANLRLTLIWTAVDTTQLLVGNCSSVIQGEGNMVRYLTRLLESLDPTLRLYETLPQRDTAQIDNILDRLCETSKHNVTTVVAACLAKSSHLAGTTTATAADILAASLCRHHKLENLPAIKTWINKLKY